MSGKASILIHSVRRITGGTETADAWVRFEAGHVRALGTGHDWTGADTVVDAAELAGPGAILTPGFIDLHGHGGGGASFEDGAAAIRTARDLHRAHGTTRAVISLVTAPLPDLVRRVVEIAELTRSDPDVLGSHLEGPFLDIARHGAHDPTLLCAPRAADVQSLLDAGGGTIKQLTIAPELPGALEAIRRIVDAGTAAAIGHTSADADQAAAAFDAGATILTHAFNAMPGIHHRAPGPVLAAIADDRVVLEAIADGVHLDPRVVRLLFRAAPGRVALITDAMAAAGAADGCYDLGAVAVTVRDGVARADETGAIAGSSLTQDAALRTAVAAGIPLVEAVLALTQTPARAIGLADQLGALEPGHPADAVLLDASLRVVRVWVGAPLSSC